MKSETSIEDSKTTEHITVSDVDSHSQCSMQVMVKNGKVVEISGNPDDPECKGELTLRGEHMLEMLYAPDRLKYPMRRVGEKGSGEWERISWDEALSIIADKLKEVKHKHGAQSIDFHHGHYHSGQLLDVYLSRLANLIGTPNVTNPSHICAGPRLFLQSTFDFGVIPTPDVAHTSCLLLWGGNPEISNKPFSMAIKEARERGAKLIVVDPRITSYAEEADIHAQLRPGTDCALAMGMLHVIVKEGLYDKAFVEKWTVGFDELTEHIEKYPPEEVEQITWVPAGKIREMARLYATIKPASISPRNALDMHTNASCAIRAINILMSITGNIDIKGGNVIVIPVSMGFEDLHLHEKLPPEVKEKKIGADKVLYSRFSGFYPSAHTPSLWNAIVDEEPYPVKAMLVFAANPLLTQANTNLIKEGLEKLDFLVVADLFMTPTAELADIVLPSCTFLERTRFATYDLHPDHGWNVPSRIMLSSKAIEPLHESKSDWHIIWELGRALGYDKYFPWQMEEEAIDEILKPLGIDCEKLKAKPEGIVVEFPPIFYKKLRGILGAIVRPILKMTLFRKYPAMYRKYDGFMKGFMTPSKKVEIYSERLKELGHDPLPVYEEPAESPISKPDLAKEYPLILIAGSKLEAYTHSMMRNIPALRSEAPEDILEINPDTATKLDIQNGDMVRVASPRGHIQCKAEVTDRIDPRVVHLHFGFAQSNANILTDNEAYDPITGSPGMKSLLCSVTKV